MKKLLWRKYKIGRNPHIGMRVRMWAKDKLEIGDHFFIGHDSQIMANAVIGDYVIFGNKVGIVGKYDHNFQEVGIPTRLAPCIQQENYLWKGSSAMTIVEDDVWVGYGTIIMSGVKIGRGSIIAAGSVVTKDVEQFSIYAGNPARKIRSRFETEEILKRHIEKYQQQFKPTQLT